MDIKGDWLQLKIIKLNLQEMNTTNQQLLNCIETNLLILKDKIKDGIDEYKNYLECLKDEKYEERKNETEEDAIKRAESIYDRLDETVRRRILVLNNGKETIDYINEVKLKIENVVENCEKDGILLEKANDELIDIIIDLEDRKRIKDIKPLQDQIDELNNKCNKRINDIKSLQDQIDEINNKFYIKKNEWEDNLIGKKREEEERKREEKERRREEKERKREEKERKREVKEEVKKRTNNTIDLNEMKQIEEWTRMKIGNIIFDSDVDNWKVNTSVFDHKIINKSNLIFLIENDDGNKFGGYINAKISGYNHYITDSKSFVFSLKSNGRLNGMFKFDITQSQSQFAFSLCYQSHDSYLFKIGHGHDIYIYKENNKNKSWCKQESFNYNRIQNALCGKSNFTPKRITVIQLI